MSIFEIGTFVAPNLRTWTHHPWSHCWEDFTWIYSCRLHIAVAINRHQQQGRTGYTYDRWKRCAITAITPFQSNLWTLIIGILRIYLHNCESLSSLPLYSQTHFIRFLIIFLSTYAREALTSQNTNETPETSHSTSKALRCKAMTPCLVHFAKSYFLAW